MSIVSPNPQFFECGENPQDALFNVERLNQGMNNSRDLASQLQGQSRPMRDAPVSTAFMSGLFGTVADTDFEGSGGGDFSDCRYWVKVQRIYPKSTSPYFQMGDENFKSMGSPAKVIAYHVGEIQYNTHALAVGVKVFLYPIPPRDGSGVMNWVMIPIIPMPEDPENKDYALTWNHTNMMMEWKEIKTCT